MDQSDALYNLYSNLSNAITKKEKLAMRNGKRKRTNQLAIDL